MPLYEFDLLDGKGKVLKTIALPLAVEQRDAVRLQRRTVPRTVAISGAAADPGAQANQILGACKRMENRMGNNSTFRKRLGMSPEKIKAAWKK